VMKWEVKTHHLVREHLRMGLPALFHTGSLHTLNSIPITMLGHEDLAFASSSRVNPCGVQSHPHNGASELAA
jgi:hypothetical protein